MSFIHPFTFFARSNRKQASSQQKRTILEVEALEEKTLLDHALGALVAEHHDHDHDHDHDEVHAHGFWMIPEGSNVTAAELEGESANFVADGGKWAQPNGLGSSITITYSYSNALDGGLSGLTLDQIRGAVEESFALWATYAPLHFVERVDSGPAAGSDSQYAAANHPDIRIGHHYIDGNTGANTLAHAYFPLGGGIAGDVHFDNGNFWNVGLFLETTLHELGHSLGLNHEPSDGNDAIMNPSVKGRFNSLGDGYLLQDDINGIRAVYGSGAGSVTPLTSQERGVGRATILSPLGTTNDRTPTLTWTAASNASRYEVWINDSSGTRVVHSTNVQGTSYVVPDNLDLGTYRAWVRAYSEDGVVGEWSDGQNFTVQAAVPGTATILTPVGTTTDRTPTVTWTAASNASRYEVWINDSSNTRVVHNTNVQGTSYAVPESLDLGTYRVWVRAYSEDGVVGEWSSGQNFTVQAALPGSATILTPVGTTSDRTPTVTWTAAANASRYEVWINDGAGTRVAHNTNVQSTSYTVTTALTAGAHRVWVRAYNAEGQIGSWSSGQDFTVTADATPGRATLLSPTGTVEDATPTVTWTEAANADRYEVWVNDSSNTRVVHSTNVQGTSYAVPTNLENGTYRVWVRAYNAGGQAGSWSEGQNFTVSVVASFDDAYEENDSSLTAFDLSNHRGQWLSTLNGRGIQRDTDWYRIYVTPGSQRLYVTTYFTHAQGDIDLVVYSSTGALVGVANSVTDNETVFQNVTTTGYYYIAVYYGNAGNSYDLWWNTYTT